MIVADVHEPERLKKVADEVKELPVDYVVVGSERKYMIERKEVMDLWASVVDGRLWKQLQYLESVREEGYIPLLWIEGSLGKLFKFTNITPYQLMGLQLAFSSFGVSVVSLSPKFGVMFLKFLNQKAGKKRHHYRPAIPKPIERTLDEERLDVLMAVRGIGEKTAEALLSRFGRLVEVANAGEDELREVLKSKTDHFIDVFKGLYDGGKKRVNSRVVENE